MRVVIQRVSEASVIVSNQRIANIKDGLVIFLGVEVHDKKEDALWIANKVASLRIFPDSQDVMNKSVVDVDGEVIVVSQFTLHAKTKKGNRPSYIRSAKPDHAILLYHEFKQILSESIGKLVQSGEFGAKMDVSLVNEGPLTICIDSKNRE